MDNFTGFRLKGEEELTRLLEGKDKLYVLACGRCFREFSADENPDCEKFIELAEKLGKTVIGKDKADFLCNATLSAKKIESIPEEAENIVVLCCGMGAQTVSELAEGPVWTACDSVKAFGEHGMALTDKACDACAQCYLGITGGICPVVDCAKSLLNGQCGGAKDGHCELDPDKPCAWQRINERLEAQGRLEEFRNRPVQLRDYSKVNFKAINEYVKEIREKRLVGFTGGLHPVEGKEPAASRLTERFPEPEILTVPLSQHSGAPAVPVVQPGDKVKVGTLLGKAEGKVSCAVHSPVSGTVEAVEMRNIAKGGQALTVIIRSDGQDTPDESLKPAADIEELSPAEIVAAIEQAGIVGLGGAAFPTGIKLKTDKPINTVLLNGCECEPVISADHRVMVEYADDVIYGLRAMMKTVGAQRGVIVIEDNKPDAIELLTGKVAGIEGLEVFPVATKYPQGAKQMILKRVLGLKSTGGRSSDLGAIVGNVSTAKAIADALLKGMPLVERIVTVAGEKIKNPGNYLVKTGTSVRELIDYCGGFTDDNVVVKMGGPMMGAVLKDLDVPVVKAANGIIAVDKVLRAETECISCGRCADVCPMELLPLRFAALAKEGGDPAEIKALGVKQCIDCGSCEFICSAGIPLVSRIKTCKKLVSEVK